MRAGADQVVPRRGTHRALLGAIDARPDHAVLVADFDGFHLVNQVRGPATADALVDALLAAAEALAGARATARCGTDAVAAVVPAATAATVAAELHEVLAHPLTVGIAGPPAAVRPVPDAIARLSAAERAVREGKEAGGGRTVWSVAEDPCEEPELAALHRALRGGEFAVAYQPIVSLESGSIAGFEALVRWEDPTRGLLLPGRFLDHADALGLLAPIGSHVMGSAIAALGAWQVDAGRPDLALHLNCSVSQLTRPSLTGVLAGQLRRAGVPPSALVVELPDEVLVHGGEVAHQLAALRGMGVRVALDRFGTGTTCLADLHRRPLDAVKVDLDLDRALGGILRQQTLVAVLQDVAHALGVELVATGVEHEDQLVPAVAMGCERAQGLLFSGPVAAHEVPELLARERFWWRAA